MSLIIPYANYEKSLTLPWKKTSGAILMVKSLCIMRLPILNVMKYALVIATQPLGRLKKLKSLNIAVLNSGAVIRNGDISEHNEIAKIKRNEICPCNSYPTAWSEKKGKKFKHCCAKK